MVFEIDPSIITPEDLRADPVLAEAADKEYVLSRTGPRTAIPSSVAYLPFTQVIPRADLQKWGKALLTPDSAPTTNSKQRDEILASRLTTDANLGQIEFYFDISNYNPYYTSQPGKKYATMLMMLQYPFSTGNVHLPPASDNQDRVRAEDKPLIDPKYYLGPGGALDFKTMTLCQRFADKICRTAPLSSILLSRVFPPATPLDTADDDDPDSYDFSSWVRDTMITDWHPMGTCGMGGTEGREGGVVDARLRVYGTRGLRVCDASVMPLQISAHLQATVYAIGEKGADMLVEDWRRGRGGVNGVNGQANGVH